MVVVSSIGNVSFPSDSAEDEIGGVAARAQTDHARSWSALNEQFRQGMLPQPPLDGRYAGALVALQVTPLLTPLLRKLTSAWMPWKGKTFNGSQFTGDNIFTHDSYLLARMLNPLYQGFYEDTQTTYRAFGFRTYVAPGLQDAHMKVLKIDYDLPPNPRLTIRRVLDELVQVGEGSYLGKAHLHWWWGNWQQVAFFTLRRAQ